MKAESRFLIKHQLSCLFNEIHFKIRCNFKEEYISNSKTYYKLISENLDFNIDITQIVHEYYREDYDRMYKVAREMCFIISKLYGLKPRLYISEFSPVYEKTPLQIRITGCPNKENWNKLTRVPGNEIFEACLKRNEQWLS